VLKEGGKKQWRENMIDQAGEFSEKPTPLHYF